MHKYPYFTVHKNQRDQIVEKVLKLQETVLPGQAAMTADLMLFLENGLGDHIMEADKQYASYLKAKA